MKECPKCGSDLITVESSREVRCSVISCDDCGYRMQDNVDEETIVEKWDNLARIKSTG